MNKAFSKFNRFSGLVFSLLFVRSALRIGVVLKLVAPSSILKLHPALLLRHLQLFSISVICGYGLGVMHPHPQLGLT